MSNALALVTGGSTGMGRRLVSALVPAGLVDGGVFTRAAWPYAQ